MVANDTIRRLKANFLPVGILSHSDDDLYTGKQMSCRPFPHLPELMFFSNLNHLGNVM